MPLLLCSIIMFAILIVMVLAITLLNSQHPSKDDILLGAIYLSLVMIVSVAMVLLAAVGMGAIYEGVNFWDLALSSMNNMGTIEK